MFGLKNNLTQAIWWLTILINSYQLLEKFIDKFYHQVTNLNGLKGRQLWVNPCHRQLAHKNSSL